MAEQPYRVFSWWATLGSLTSYALGEFGARVDDASQLRRLCHQAGVHYPKKRLSQGKPGSKLEDDLPAGRGLWFRDREWGVGAWQLLAVPGDISGPTPSARPAKRGRDGPAASSSPQPTPGLTD